MISNLQLLRGLAALAVVFFHTSFVIPGMQRTNFQAVAVFFVISGFIMTYITRNTADGFLLNRVVRIVPLYWMATIADVVWTKFGFNTIPQTWTNPRRILAEFQHFVQTDQTAFFGDLASSLLFIPRFDGAGAMRYPLLAVGWTLNLEMFFYVIFAVMLCINRRLAPLLVAGFLSAVIGYSKIFGCGDLCRFYSHDFVQYFIYGIAAYYAWRALAAAATSRTARAVAITASALAIAGYLVVEATVNGGARIAPVALVLALLVLHSASIRCDWRWAVVFGDASYALYLTHLIVVDTMRPLAAQFPVLDFSTAPIGLAVTLATCLIVALLTHFFVEKPTLKWLRRRLEARNAAQPHPSVLGT
jgi:exopolysaccharide production protein ExoZ